MKGPKNTQLHALSWEGPSVMGLHAPGSLGHEPRLRAQGVTPTTSGSGLHGGSLGNRMAAWPCIPPLPLWVSPALSEFQPMRQGDRQVLSEKGPVHCRAPLPIMPATSPSPTARGSALQSLIGTYKNATSDQTREAASPPRPSRPLLPILLTSWNCSLSEDPS